MLKKLDLIENFLDLPIANEIDEHISSISFPWFWQYTTVYDNENYDNNLINDYQFTHTFVNNTEISSNSIGIIYAILEQFQKVTGIKYKSIIRAKANLLPRMIDWNKEFDNYGIHIDQTNPNCLSLLYYVIDSDGDTFFYDDDKKVTKQFSPLKNNLVYFNSDIFHKPSPPILNKRRIIISIILEL